MIDAKWRPRQNHTQSPSSPVLIDPALMKAALQVYRAYCQAHPNAAKRPTGVAVNQLNYQGKILFSSHPVLLPQEYFIPISQLESEFS